MGKGLPRSPQPPGERVRGCPCVLEATGFQGLIKELSKPLSPTPAQLSKEQSVRAELGFTAAQLSSWPPVELCSPTPEPGFSNNPKALRACLLKEETLLSLSISLCHVVCSAGGRGGGRSSPPGHFSSPSRSSCRDVLTPSPPPGPRLPAHFAPPMSGDSEGWSDIGLGSDSPSAWQSMAQDDALGRFVD